MATVRFSKELIDSIVNAANRQLEPRVEAAKKSLDLPTGVGDIIYKRIFGKHEATALQLPDGWVRMVSDINVSFTCNSLNPSELSRTQKHSMTFSLTGKHPWPHEIKGDDNIDRGVYGNYISLKRTPLWSDLYAIVEAWVKRVHDAEMQQAQYRDSVVKILQTYTTLAPALKAWPPLWDLLPEHTKNKHKEVVEKKKSDAKLEVDLEQMTAVAIAAKIGGI